MPRSSATDGANVSFASLHECNLVEPCRSHYRGALTDQASMRPRDTVHPWT